MDEWRQGRREGGVKRGKRPVIISNFVSISRQRRGRDWDERNERVGGGGGERCQRIPDCFQIVMVKEDRERERERRKKKRNS